MAAISSIKEIPDATLTGQVDKAARPRPEKIEKSAPSEAPDNVEVSKVRQNSELVKTEATSSEVASYEETLAVAEKLQSRIDEIASAPHSVSIRTDEASQQFVIQIQDPDGEVVKQFPSEKVLNLHKKLDDLSGMVIDEMI